MRTLGLAAAAAALTVALNATPARAGTFIIEGSDAIGFHAPLGQAGAQTYAAQFFNAIGGADPRKIAVIGTNVTNTPTSSYGGHAVLDFATVAGAGSLNNYVAVYFLAGSGCCSEDDSLITAAGAQTAVSNYLAAGGTVAVENYIGGAAWDFAFNGGAGAGGAGNAHVAGVSGGNPGSFFSDDGELVTATGTANGFTQPPVLGNWDHQAYDKSYFQGLGFVNTFFSSDANNFGPDNAAALMGTGTTASATPEPASVVLACVGIASIAGYTRRRKQPVVA
jgi:hypothetical protein